MRHADWRQTSLKPYVDMLDRHCVGLMRQTRENKRSQSSLYPVVGPRLILHEFWAEQMQPRRTSDALLVSFPCTSRFARL